MASAWQKITVFLHLKKPKSFHSDFIVGFAFFSLESTNAYLIRQKLQLHQTEYILNYY